MNDNAFSKLRVLIVDDNKHMRLLLEAILKAFGCKMIQQATGAEEAYKLLKTYMPDMIFADLVMYPVDGIAFARKVRSDAGSPNPFLPLIMISGHASLDRIHEARNAGVNEFLVKPISPDGVFRRIQAVIENPRPFVRTKDYFGPDRRRSTSANYDGPERRSDANVFDLDDVPVSAAVGR